MKPFCAAPRLRGRRSRWLHARRACRPGSTVRVLPKSTAGAIAGTRRSRCARAEPGGDQPGSARVYKGTGVLVKGQQPGGGARRHAPPVQQAGGGVVLNFEGADLREVVRNILGDILNESYTIDPAVGGQ